MMTPVELSEAVTDQPASSNAAFVADELTNDAEVKQQNGDDSVRNSSAADDKEDELEKGPTADDKEDDLEKGPTADDKDDDLKKGPTADDKKDDLKKGRKVGVEFGLGVDGGSGCVRATAEYGSICTKDVCGGVSQLDFKGPAIGCTLSKGEGLEIVSDCTTSCCTADFIIAECMLCTLGLALDTKLVLNQGGAEFAVMGTGMDTSEGFALTALGSKIGYADMEKVKRAREIRRAKQEKKTKEEDDVVDQQPTGQTPPTTEQD